MTDTSLQSQIEALWERRETLSTATTGADRDAVEAALLALDSGKLRVATPGAGGWVVNEWLKKAVLLSFRLNDNRIVEGGGAGAPSYDKVPLKFAGWDQAAFAAAGFRAVPGSIVRRSAFIAPGVVLMPSFVNAGAYVDSGTMVDTWVTIGSCAQIGKNCHISGGVGIGGVLEPLQAAPSSLRTAASSARVRKWPKVSWSNAAACCPWACSLAHPPRLSTATRVRSSWAAFRPIPLSCPARCRRVRPPAPMASRCRRWTAR